MHPTEFSRRLAIIPSRTAVLVTACLTPLLGACDKEEEAIGSVYCEDWPTELEEATRTLDSRYDDCGYWSVPAGEHLYINVYVYEELVACASELGPGLTLFAEPTWSNFEGGGMKWTYDVLGDAPADDWAEFSVICDDGAVFEARVLVTD